MLIARQVQLWLKREQEEDRRRWFEDIFFYQALSVLLLGLALPVAADQLNLPTPSFLPQATGLFVGAGVAALLFYWRNQRRWSVACYLLAVGLSIVLVTQDVFPQVDSSQSSRRLAAFLQQEGFVGQPLFVYGISRNVAYGLGFYLNSEARIVYSEGDMSYPPGVEAFFITSPEFEPAAFFTRTEVGKTSEFQSRRILRVTQRLE